MLALLLLLPACAPAWNLDTDGDKVRVQAQTLSGNRHVPNCAPEEWARVKVHEKAAQVALENGDGNLARWHLDQAMAAFEQAVDRLQGCAPGDRDVDGLEDDIDKCPDQAEDFDDDRDQDGCPDVDSDGDGLEDDVDKCPGQAEDMDGFMDSDGCPDPDNDGDGIADDKDRCPMQAEVMNGYLDEDGCPDTAPQLVVLESKRIAITEQVRFSLGAATIEPSSFALLDDVARVLTDNPSLEVRIEGHTDNVGDEKLNIRLSQARAESVRTFLVDRGINPARLEAVGYGPTRPIDTNRTEEGRANNRRVEFVIVRGGG